MLLQYKILGIFILVIALFSEYAHKKRELIESGRVLGRQEVRIKWDAEKKERMAAENAAILTRVKNNERLADQQALVNQAIKKGYDHEIATLRTTYATAGRLRVSQNFCSGFATSTQTQSTGGGLGTDAGTGLLPAAADRDLKQFGQLIEEKFASCRAAQAFIVESGLAP